MSAEVLQARRQRARLEEQMKLRLYSNNRDVWEDRVSENDFEESDFEGDDE